MTVGVVADQRLQQRGCELESQRDQADLRKGEVKIALEQRVNCEHQRLNRVVEEMRKTDRGENPERGRIVGAVVLAQLPLGRLMRSKA